jgi:hypothetical protein
MVDTPTAAAGESDDRGDREREPHPLALIPLKGVEEGGACSAWKHDTCGV